MTRTFQIYWTLSIVIQEFFYFSKIIDKSLGSKITVNIHCNEEETKKKNLICFWYKMSYIIIHNCNFTVICYTFHGILSLCLKLNFKSSYLLVYYSDYECNTISKYTVLYCAIFHINIEQGFYMINVFLLHNILSCRGESLIDQISDLDFYVLEKWGIKLLSNCSSNERLVLSIADRLKWWLEFWFSSNVDVSTESIRTTL